MKKIQQAVTTGIAAVVATLMVANGAMAFGGNSHKHKMHKLLKNHRIKNVIVMIPDGCDETVQTAARWYKGEDLQVDHMQGGGVMQHMANSVITGSAAAATAFATGHKTTVRFLGIGPRTSDLLTGFEPTAEPYAPVASILEAAQLRGKATGIVATSRVTHATPAAFACHVQDRGWDNDIMEHMVYNDIDVVFGGGARHLIPENESYDTTFGATWNGRRNDGENLMDVLLDRGYQFVDNKDDMAALTDGPVWGLFDDSHMQPDIDRQYFAEHEPSLAEMTAKAIELLSQDSDGFFLMVEGSQVDWAGHNNDPVYMVTDFLAFDDAVKVACDFADEDGRTLVMAYPDHNTGGMKIGHYYTAMGYTETTIEDLVDPLTGMKITSGGLVNMLEDDTDAELMDKVAEYWSLDITQDDVDEIREMEPSLGLNYALARVISKNYTVIGWTTHGHNGETVPLWVYGAHAPIGIIDNTELATIAAEAMFTDLDRITNRLYVDLDTVTDDYVIDDTDPENLVLKAGNAEMPISKNYMVKNGHTIKMPGLTVYAPETGKVYVSQKALFLMGLLF
ncbi:MAG: alkaline phosphatase [Thermodesulfobacteriota bacterium]|nr:alkaline phosphatase [Thermodesulfobacteriota bacterium]